MEERTKVGIFISPTCPHCPVAKGLLKELLEKRKDFFVEEYDIATTSGLAVAKQHDVKGVPTFFIKGPKYGDTIAFTGAVSKDRLENAIDITQGSKNIKDLEDKKESFVQKIMSLFK